MSLVTQPACTASNGNHWIGINGITMIHYKVMRDEQRVHQTSALFPRYRE